MNTTPNFISETKLNVLLERVCKPIDYLSTPINSATPLWEGPIKMCLQIEADPFMVDSVVLEAKRYQDHFRDNRTPQYFHAILCRVYILLYYRHRDDKLYQEIVYQRLFASMGIYNDTHLNTINKRIDKILEQERLLEKCREDKKRDVKPVFAYVEHTWNERVHLYIEYSDEELFRSMKEYLKKIVVEYVGEFDVSNIWYNAKKVVHTLRDIKRPELMIEIAATSLVDGQRFNEYEGSQIILLCAYLMIRASRNNTHFTAFIKAMEALANEETRLSVINESINELKNIIDEGLPSDDYDYIGEQVSSSPMYSEADVERIRLQIVKDEKEQNDKLLKQIKELKAENESLKERCATLKADLRTEIEKNEGLSKPPTDIDEIIVELLKPVFYNEEDKAKEFLEYARGKADTEILDKIIELSDQRVISSKSYRRDLWRIMHAFKLYSATESNWNTYLNTHTKTTKQ